MKERNVDSASGSKKLPAEDSSPVAREVIVVAKCIGCEATKNVRRGEIAANDVPICDACGMPMIATKAEAK